MVLEKRRSNFLILYLDQKIVEELLEETQFFSNFPDVNKILFLIGFFLLSFFQILVKR
jgi:uncharacterized protein YlbG (UPF0298 family)